MQTMTQADYARHRGVNPSRINVLVKKGEIPVVKTRDGPRIDVKGADAILNEKVGAKMPPNMPPQTSPGLAAAAGHINATPSGLARARTATEVYKARLNQLRYEERIGQLVKAEDLVRSMEQCAEMVVRHLDRIPTKAEEMAAAFTSGGLPALRKALKDEIRAVRKTLADNMRMHAADGAAVAEADEDGFEGE